MQGIATTRDLGPTWSLAVPGCVRLKSTMTLKMLWSGADAVALAAINLNRLAGIVLKILTSALRSVVAASRHAGQHRRRACALATMAKRMAEHGCKICLNAARPSAAQLRALKRVVSRSVNTLVARLQISTVATAMTILTGACKSTRTVTSGPARKPEMLAIAPSDRVTTGRNAERL